MKKLLILLFLLTTSFVVVEAQTNSSVADTKTWTWFGIDYTNCYFIMSYDFPSVSDLESKIGAWNDLVLLEREKFIEKTLKSKNVEYSVDMVKSLNEEMDVKSRISNDGMLSKHLDPGTIPEIISSYDIPEGLSGVGLVFIAESYSKPDEQGAYYVTFFDIGTKKVLSSERMLGKAKGFGLRNFWANSYYVILKELGKTYK